MAVSSASACSLALRPANVLASIYCTSAQNLSFVSRRRSRQVTAAPTSVRGHLCRNRRSYRGSPSIRCCNAWSLRSQSPGSEIHARQRWLPGAAHVGLTAPASPTRSSAWRASRLISPPPSGNPTTKGSSSRKLVALPVMQLALDRRYGQTLGEPAVEAAHEKRTKTRCA